MEHKNLARWRLILGKDADDMMNRMEGGEGSFPLTEEESLLDQTLHAIYGNDQDSFASRVTGKGSGGGKGKSSPKISKWLGDLRSLFDNETVTIVQNDAIERKGLKELLLEPEILDNLEPDINMAETILMLKDQIPQKSKESARNFIQKIVEKINSLLAEDIRRSVTAALNKKEHSPLPQASSIDYKYTIRRNLKNYNPDLGTIIPEKVWFFDHSAKVNKWNIILDIDQSGSMGESIIYSSIMSCILASMSSVKTSVVAFDTEVVDLTPLCEDPVELLFGFQMGGGTDIQKSVAYCQTLVEEPANTLFFLISDLEEYGSREPLLRRLEELHDSGVTVVVLLAIADGGRAYYDTATARKIASMDIPCFACPPERLPELLERALKKEDLSALASQSKA